MSPNVLFEPIKIPEQQTGMPRRFGIGSIMVITVAFSLLYALLRGFRAPGPLYAFLTMFFVVIAIAQMVLFGGRDPRRASILTGLFLLPICVVISLPFLDRHGPDSTGVACFFVFSFPLGALLGYCAGGLIGGVFL